MKNQFVPYELAVKLKELGFDENCLAGYSMWQNPTKNSVDIQFHIPSGKYSNWSPIPFYGKYTHRTKDLVKTPLWQQAFDWIRENFNITFWIEPCGGWVKKAHLWEYVIVTHDNRYIGTRSEYHEEQESLLRRLIRIIEEEEYDK